jgi:hypothetical protein
MPVAWAVAFRPLPALSKPNPAALVSPPFPPTALDDTVALGTPKTIASDAAAPPFPPQLVVVLAPPSVAPFPPVAVALAWPNLALFALLVTAEAEALPPSPPLPASKPRFTGVAAVAASRDGQIAKIDRRIGDRSHAAASRARQARSADAVRPFAPSTPTTVTTSAVAPPAERVFVNGYSHSQGAFTGARGSLSLKSSRIRDQAPPRLQSAASSKRRSRTVPSAPQGAWRRSPT